MASSFHRENKFAFLFTGSAGTQYAEDLRKVVTTLIRFYGYPAANLCIVAGEQVNEFDEVNYPDPASIFQTAGLVYDPANPSKNKFILSGTDKQSELEGILSNFYARINTASVSGFRNSVLFYFTGEGSKGTVGPITFYYLQIADGTTPVKVDQTWLTTQIPLISYPENNINIVMQQSYSYGFYSGNGGLNILADSSLQMTFTAACDTNEGIVANSSGSAFTDYWTKGLQLVRHTVGTVDIYADQEDTNTALPGDPSNAEPTTNLLVSFKKAYFYAKLHSGLLPKFEFKDSGSSEDYLGLPEFWIRDGDEPIPPETADYWWESKDIYIDTPYNDYYIAGASQNVYIRVTNSGTHPVRRYCLGYKHFGTGLGTIDSTGVVTRSILSGLAVVFKPGDIDTYSYPETFATGTHRCIRARAKLIDFTTAQIDNYSDWSDALIPENSFEAQRNTDPISGPPVEEELPPEPEEAQEPDQDPEPGQQDENNPGDRTLRNLRNVKEHIFYLFNPFKEKRRFRVVIKNGFREEMKNLHVRFYRLEGDKEKPRKFIPLRISRVFYPFLQFVLNPEEKVDLMYALAFKKGVKFEGMKRLPMEIYTEKTARERNVITRKPVLGFLFTKFIPIGGITIKLSQKSLSIKGTVVDRNGKAVSDATVFIRTTNRLQAAVLKTNSEGKFSMPRLGLDSYTIYAKTKSLTTDTKIVNLIKDDTVVELKEKA